MAKRVRMQRDGKVVRFFMRDDERPQDGEKEISEKAALALLNQVQEPPKNKPLAPPKGQRKTAKKLKEEEFAAQQEELQRETRELAELEAADALELGDEDETLSPPKKSAKSSSSSPSKEEESSILESPGFWGLVGFGGILASYYTKRRP